jgi:hypothetical protein
MSDTLGAVLRPGLARLVTTGEAPGRCRTN